MRALVFDNALRLDPRHAEPPAHEGDALIRVRQAGVCSTDLEICKGYMGFKGILGHEFVGDVLECPSHPDLVGKRVVGEINCACGSCELCTAGLSNHCPFRSVLGIDRHGGAFAELLRLPARNLHVLPESVDDDQAVFVEPLAAAFQILKQVPVGPTTFVTVLGDGRLGLLVAQVLARAGAPVRVVGRHGAKLELCEKWQIKARRADQITGKKDQDVVVDCTGSAEGFELAMHLVRPRGTIVLKSTVASGKSLNLAPLVIDEINVVGSRCGPFREAIHALELEQIDVVSLIHRRFKLDDAASAVEYAGRPGVLKVVVQMQ